MDRRGIAAANHTVHRPLGDIMRLLLVRFTAVATRFAIGVTVRARDALAAKVERLSAH